MEVDLEEKKEEDDFYNEFHSFKLKLTIATATRTTLWNKLCHIQDLVKEEEKEAGTVLPSHIPR